MPADLHHSLFMFFFSSLDRQASIDGVIDIGSMNDESGIYCCLRSMNIGSKEFEIRGRIGLVSALCRVITSDNIC